MFPCFLWVFLVFNASEKLTGILFIFLKCDQIFGQVFDQFFGQGFDQVLGEGKKP